MAKNRKEIILDFGSGNTCKNDYKYIERMINSLVEIDSDKHGHEVIIKWQLFKKAGKNIPLDQKMFEYAYYYAEDKGYKTTASVFDLDSLMFLLQFKNIPFVKIANNKDLYWLIPEVPRKYLIYVSNGTVGASNRFDSIFSIMDSGYFGNGVKILSCVSKYPAKLEDYDKLDISKYGFISDHTVDFKLYYKYNPSIIEWHYKLSDSIGLDAGAFARTPEQLKEVLGYNE